MEYLQTLLVDLEKSVRCAICLESLKNPLTTRCDHHFCGDCIRQALKGKTEIPCPLCMKTIRQRSLKKAVRLISIVNAVHETLEKVQECTGTLDVLSQSNRGKQVADDDADPQEEGNPSTSGVEVTVDTPVPPSSASTLNSVAQPLPSLFMVSADIHPPPAKFQKVEKTVTAQLPEKATKDIAANSIDTDKQEDSQSQLVQQRIALTSCEDVVPRGSKVGKNGSAVCLADGNISSAGLTEEDPYVFPVSQGPHSSNTKKCKTKRKVGPAKKYTPGLTPKRKSDSPQVVKQKKRKNSRKTKSTQAVVSVNGRRKNGEKSPEQTSIRPDPKADKDEATTKEPVTVKDTNLNEGAEKNQQKIIKDCPHLQRRLLSASSSSGSTDSRHEEEIAKRILPVPPGDPNQQSISDKVNKWLQNTSDIANISGSSASPNQNSSLKSDDDQLSPFEVSMSPPQRRTILLKRRRVVSPVKLDPHIRESVRNQLWSRDAAVFGHSRAKRTYQPRNRIYGLNTLRATENIEPLSQIEPENGTMESDEANSNKAIVSSEACTNDGAININDSNQAKLNKAADDSIFDTPGSPESPPLDASCDEQQSADGEKNMKQDEPLFDELPILNDRLTKQNIDHNSETTDSQSEFGRDPGDVRVTQKTVVDDVEKKHPSATPSRFEILSSGQIQKQTRSSLPSLGDSPSVPKPADSVLHTASTGYDSAMSDVVENTAAGLNVVDGSEMGAGQAVAIVRPIADCRSHRSPTPPSASEKETLLPEESTYNGSISQDDSPSKIIIQSSCAAVSPVKTSKRAKQLGSNPTDATSVGEPSVSLLEPHKTNEGGADHQNQPEYADITSTVDTALDEPLEIDHNKTSEQKPKTSEKPNEQSESMLLPESTDQSEHAGSSTRTCVKPSERNKTDIQPKARLAPRTKRRNSYARSDAELVVRKRPNGNSELNLPLTKGRKCISNTKEEVSSDIIDTDSKSQDLIPSTWPVVEEPTKSSGGTFSLSNFVPKDLPKHLTRVSVYVERLKNLPTRVARGRRTKPPMSQEKSEKLAGGGNEATVSQNNDADDISSSPLLFSTQEGQEQITKPSGNILSYGPDKRKQGRNMRIDLRNFPKTYTNEQGNHSAVELGNGNVAPGMPFLHEGTDDVICCSWEDDKKNESCHEDMSSINSERSGPHHKIVDSTTWPKPHEIKPQSQKQPPDTSTSSFLELLRKISTCDKALLKKQHSHCAGLIEQFFEAGVKLEKSLDVMYQQEPQAAEVEPYSPQPRRSTRRSLRVATSRETADVAESRAFETSPHVTKPGTQEKPPPAPRKQIKQMISNADNFSSEHLSSRDSASAKSSVSRVESSSKVSQDLQSSFQAHSASSEDVYDKEIQCQDDSNDKDADLEFVDASSHMLTGGPLVETDLNQEIVATSVKSRENSLGLIEKADSVVAKVDSWLKGWSYSEKNSPKKKGTNDFRGISPREAETKANQATELDVREEYKSTSSSLECKSNIPQLEAQQPVANGFTTGHSASATQSPENVQCEPGLPPAEDQCLDAPFLLQKEVNRTPMVQQWLNTLNATTSKKASPARSLDEKPRLGLVATGLQEKEVRYVKAFARKYNGEFYASFNQEKVTHVIVKTTARLSCDRTLKYLQGIASKKWVVSLNWVVESLTCKTKLPEEDFEVIGDNCMKEFEVQGCVIPEGPRRSRMSESGYKHLAGFRCVCLPPYGLISTAQASDLLEMCGATSVGNLGSLMTADSLVSDQDERKLIIIDMEASSERSIDYSVLAEKFKAAVVTIEWIYESISRFEAQTVEDFLVTGQSRDVQHTFH